MKNGVPIYSVTQSVDRALKICSGDMIKLAMGSYNHCRSDKVLTAVLTEFQLLYRIASLAFALNVDNVMCSRIVHSQSRKNYHKNR